MKALFGMPTEENEQEQPTTTGVDPDVPVVEESELERPTTVGSIEELFKAQPTAEEPEAEQPELPEVDSSSIPTSYTGFYGPDLLRREQELLGTQMGPGETGEFTQVEGGLTEGQKAELESIRAQKREKYDAIQGSNVTSLDVGPIAIGKIIKDPDGSRKFLPPPTATESTQMVDKAILDTARGIAGIPEFFGFEGYQDLVPEVASEDEAVLLGAELTQLTFGGMAALKLTEKGPKIYHAVEKIPGFKAFMKGTEELTPDFIKRGVDYAKLGLQGVEKTVPKGTIPVAVGAAAVADEDIGTFFGSPDMTMAEAKTRMLAETMAFGAVFNLASAAGEVTRLAPGISYLARNINAGFTALFAKPDQLDEKVMEQLGEVVYRNNKRLANAQTQEEINQAYEETYQEISQTYKNITGKDLTETLVGDALPPPGQGDYVPSIGEVFDDDALMRLYKGLALKGGSKQADQILSQMLNDADLNRLEALKERARIGEAQLAPRGEEAAVEVREALAPQIAEEQATIARVGREETEQVTTQTERMLKEAGAREEAAMAQAQATRQAAEEEVLTTATDVQRTLEKSPGAKTQLDALDQSIDTDGTMQIIDDVLTEDLNMVREASRTKDEAYRAVEIPPEESARIVDDMLVRISDDDFVRANPEAARGILGKFIRMFRETGEEIAPAPTPGAPTPTPRPKGPLQEELTQLQNELEAATTAQEILRISKRIRELTRRGIRPASEGAGEVAEELPTITLADLDMIAMDARDAARKAKVASRSNEYGNAQKRRLFQLGEDFDVMAKSLSDDVNQYVTGNPVAQEARDEFTRVFTPFKERWRTQTGREWQGDIIESKTQADIADTASKIIKVFKNPKTTDANIIQIRNIVQQMPEDVRTQFTQNIGTQILADFTRARGVMPATDSVKTVAQARQLKNRLDEYMQGVARYEEVMPGALEQLRALSRSLDEVLAPAERAVTRRGVTEAEAKAAERAARVAGAEETRVLTRQEQEQLSAINARMSEARSVVNNSTLQSFLKVDNPTDFISRLYRDQRGAQKFQELWSRAGTVGEPLEGGLTATQEALRESAMKGLLMRVYTPTQEAVDAGRFALQDIVDAMNRPQSTPGQIFSIATNGDPAAKEFMDQFQKSIASYQRSLTGGQIPGSRTAEVAALQRLTNDVLMVIYGPLTQNFRIARFIANATFKSQTPEEKIAEAWGRVLTEPRYYKGVLDKAKELAEKGLVPEEQAFSTAFAAGLLSAAGYNKYMQADDPAAEMLREYRQYTTVQQTEDALREGQEPPSTPE